MYVTLFPDLGGYNATEYQTDWPGFVDWLSRFPIYPSKKHCPLIKLARFSGHRNDNNLYAISGIEGDHDAGTLTPDTAAQILQASGVAAVVVTTPSHTSDCPRWRVYAPTSTELAPDQRHDLTGRINAVLGDVLSVESFTASQAFYVGPVQDVQYEIYIAQGNYIDTLNHLPSHGPPKSQGAGSGDPLSLAPKRAHDINQIVAALDAIPNDQPDWEFWNRIGMAVYVAGNGSDEAMAAWESWSDRAGIERGTDSCYKRWLHYHKSPPTNIGMGTLVQLAGGQRAIAPAPTAQPGEMGEGVTIGSGFKYFDVPWRDTKLNGKPTGSIENLITLLDYAGITVRYNLMTKEPEILIPGAAFLRDNAMNNALSTVSSLAAIVEYPTANIQEYILTIAGQNPHHPVKTWIESRQWDGRDRLQQLIDSLNPSNPQAATMLISKWLATAIDAVMKPDGVSAQGCLVLQGPQNAGKTRWLAALVGDQRDAFKEGHILDPKDKDSVKQAIRYWITELGELDATFRRSDISALKAFITRDLDEFRAPYARAESCFPRKTVFAASVNPQEFLHDDTGNRRYWTIEVGPNMNADHGIDMQQVWAQIVAQRNHYTIWLNADELQMLNDVNSEFETYNSLEELIRNNYDLKAPRIRDLTATEILQEVGVDPNKFNNRSGPAIISKAFGRSRKKNGRKVYRVPVKLSDVQKAFLK